MHEHLTYERQRAWPVRLRTDGAEELPRAGHVNQAVGHLRVKHARTRGPQCARRSMRAAKEKRHGADCSFEERLDCADGSQRRRWDAEHELTRLIDKSDKGSTDQSDW
eukprot:4195126-Pleurochrysis_carterae.AAC.1